MPTSSSSRRRRSHTSSESMDSVTPEDVTTEPSRRPARTSSMNLLSRFSILAVEELSDSVN